MVCTGGEEESMYTELGRDSVVLSKTKGFVRLALSHGASLVPVFGVGNTDCYKTYGLLFGARLWLQRNTGIALPIFHAAAVQSPDQCADWRTDSNTKAYGAGRTAR